MDSGVRLKLYCCAALTCFAAATTADKQSAFQKLGEIESGAARPGSRVSFTRPEIDAWLVEEAKVRVPQGLRSPHLELSDGLVVGSATIDFLKVRQAAGGGDPGWLFKSLLAGERPVVVTARFRSAGGKARADVEKVEISGVAIEGRALEFVIDSYVKPTFPDIKVNQWFPLNYGVERFTIGPRGVVVLMAAKRPRFAAGLPETPRGRQAAGRSS